MARYLFGSGGDAEINSPSTGLPQAGVTANVYNAQTGGSVVTDLQDKNGVTISQPVSDAYGQFSFKGPDAYTSTLWLDLGIGPRWAMRPVDIAGIASAAATAGVSTGVQGIRNTDYSGRTFTTIAGLPKNANDPLENALALALDNQIVPRIAFANRGASFPAPVAGDRYYDTTFQKTYRFDGTNWLQVDGGPYSTLTPTWSSNGTAPSLLNGTSSLRFHLDSKRCKAVYRLTAGSTTTFGTGLYTFNLPQTAHANAVGTLGTAVLTQGSTRYGGVCQVTATNTLTIYLSNSGSITTLVQWGATVPVTFASGNIIDAAIDFEIA